MKQNLYAVTTSRLFFHVTASDIAYAAQKATKHIHDTTTKGVEPERIDKIEYVGKYMNVNLNEMQA